MKKKLSQIISFVVRNNFLWSLLKPFITLGKILESHRKSHKPEYLAASSKIRKALGAPIVKNGPFRGMKYPNYISHGSSEFSKIIGSYERELHHVISNIISANYNQILDIGSAEGYYAVGLAMRNPDTKIFAYDISKNANQKCLSLAIKNNVEDQIQINSFCDSNTLKNFNFINKTLIICDCEGCEKKLFTKENINNLINVDLIIEVHDFIDITISGYLFDIFKETHSIEIIKSISDIEKTKTYNYPDVEHLSLIEKRYLFSENRPDIMEWYYLKSNKG